MQKMIYLQYSRNRLIRRRRGIHICDELSDFDELPGIKDYCYFKQGNFRMTNSVVVT